MNEIEVKSEKPLLLQLAKVTGARYVFAVGACRTWNTEDNYQKGTFYQIMPFDTDDGFFDWYCLERIYNQFFETKEEAVDQFLIYRRLWQRTLEPAT